MFRMFRKVICLVSFVLVLGLVGDVRSASVWTDTTGNHLWNTPENWFGNELPIWTDNYNSVVKIGLVPGPIITNNVAARMQCMLLGYNDFTGELTMNNGTLRTKTWIMLGYDEGSMGTLNMNGGTIIIGSCLNVGSSGSGVLNMAGGTITTTDPIRGFFCVKGQVNLDGGVIATRILTIIKQTAFAGIMNVKAGTLIMDGNGLSGVQNYIDKDWIVAYDGQGILQLDYDSNEDKTTLKAFHILSPNPVHSSNGALASDNQLQWTLPKPEQPGGVVTCDVYFGVDPDVEKNPKIVDCEAIESMSVALAPDTIYYWALNLYDSSISATEPYMLSSVFIFNTLNRVPIVNAGADVATWLQEGVVRIGDLDATIIDDNRPLPYTVQWTVISEPNDPNSPDAVIADPNIEDTSIALSTLGEYILQIEAFDGEYFNSDTVAINMYVNSCEAAQSLPSYVSLVGDLNGDCRVDELDMILLEENWLKDNSLIEEWFVAD